MVGFLVHSAPADAAGKKLFDYQGRKIGAGGYLGLGVVSQEVGATFQFGARAKINLWRGINLDPGFNMYIKKGGWDITFSPAPQYIFRFAKVIVHPYAGFGPALHIFHVPGEETREWDPWTGQWVTKKGKGETGVRFGLHWTWGVEIALTPEISLYNDYRFHLVFEAPDIFSLTVGIYYFFK